MMLQIKELHNYVFVDLVPETGIEPVRPLFTKRRILRTQSKHCKMRFTSVQRLRANL